MAASKSLMDLAPQRVLEVPAEIVAAVSEAPANGTRTLYEWAIDAYNTVHVRVYGPQGESLPAEGLTFGYKDLTWIRLDNKRVLKGAWNEDGGADEWFVRIDIAFGAAAAIDPAAFRLTVKAA